MTPAHWNRLELREQIQVSLGDAYTLERELDGAGMSRVFVAHERGLGRQVVIKVLSPEEAATIRVERFAREIRLAASLQQANIVPVLSAGTAAVRGRPRFAALLRDAHLERAALTTIAGARR